MSMACMNLFTLFFHHLTSLISKLLSFKNVSRKHDVTNVIHDVTRKPPFQFSCNAAEKEALYQIKFKVRSVWEENFCLALDHNKIFDKIRAENDQPDVHLMIYKLLLVKLLT